jgi:acyl-CoA synthetase (AMP-forming)/AMP-acid ligase II
MSTINFNEFSCLQNPDPTIQCAHIGMPRTESLSRDRVVAVCIGNQIQLAKYLTMFLGNCGRMVIVPSDLSEIISTSFIDELGINLFISDKRFDDKLKLPWFSMTAKEWFLIQADERVIVNSENLTGEVLLATSGTTGAPKIVAHSKAALLPNSKYRSINTDKMIWGSLYSFDRFAGLQVLLRAIWDRATMIVVEKGQTSSQIVYNLIKNECNSLSGTPSMWRKILMTPSHSSIPLRQITLGGEIADQNLLQALRYSFPLARISHVYASTEVGSVFSVHDGLPGFPTSLLDDRCLNHELRIVEGRLYVKRRDGSGRYVGIANAISDSEGYVDTGDDVEISGDRVLFIGRNSTKINIGGNKVYPDEIEEVLREIPGVAAAKVFGFHSNILGNLICAQATPENTAVDKQDLISNIRNHCLTRLVSWKRPARVQIVDQLAIGCNGKLFRGPDL